MSFYNFTNQLQTKYNDATSKMAKDYINKSTKITKAKLGITFINTCQNQELLPVFTRLNLGNELRHDEHFKTGIRNRLMEKELDNKH